MAGRYLLPIWGFNHDVLSIAFTRRHRICSGCSSMVPSLALWPPGMDARTANKGQTDDRPTLPLHRLTAAPYHPFDMRDYLRGDGRSVVLFDKDSGSQHQARHRA